MATIIAADQPNAILYTVVAGVVILSSIFYLLVTRHRPYPGIPVASLEQPRGLQSWLPAKAEYPIYGSRLIEKGKQLTSGCFQIRAGAGWKIIVPSRFAQEIGTLPQLSFTEIGRRDFHINLPGFEGVKEGFREDGLMVDVVRMKLTQNLGLVTDAIVEETPLALQQILGDKAQGKAVPIKDTVLDIVAWVSTRVFAGPELARDGDWRRVSKQYTMLLFRNAHLLRRYPKFLRPLANQWLSSCQEMRERLQEARKLVERQLDARLRQREQNRIDEVKSIDCFHWMLDVAKGRPLDFSGAQLQLGVVAINTTTELMVRCILQLCDSPDIVPALRKEMINVLKENGWTNASLHKMKLLDAFIKETQRMDSMFGATMARVAKQKVNLSDGTVFPAGSFIMTMNDQLLDPNVYPDPAKFDPYRYLKLRARAGEENKHQFATALPNNLGFGYGSHACSGRFFASNLMKVVLCFMLLEYDIAYDAGSSRLPRIEMENAFIIDPRHRVRITRRKEELDLLNPKDS